MTLLRSLCDREGCEQVRRFIVAVRISPNGENWPAPLIARTSFTVCGDCSDEVTVDEVFDQADWQRLNQNFIRQGLSIPDPQRAEIVLEPFP